MIIQQIKEICAWVENHPKHDIEKEFKGCTPAEIFLKLCLDLTQISDYEDPKNAYMSEEGVENGCTYVFKRGSLMRMRCNCPPVEGTQRCKFHNHLIFSDEFANYIKQYHDNINVACGN